MPGTAAPAAGPALRQAVALLHGPHLQVLTCPALTRSPEGPPPRWAARWVRRREGTLSPAPPGFFPLPLQRQQAPRLWGVRATWGPCPAQPFPGVGSWWGLLGTPGSLSLTDTGGPPPSSLEPLPPPNPQQPAFRLHPRHPPAGGSSHLLCTDSAHDTPGSSLCFSVPASLWLLHSWGFWWPRGDQRTSCWFPAGGGGGRKEEALEVLPKSSVPFLWHLPSEGPIESPSPASGHGLVRRVC